MTPRITWPKIKRMVFECNCGNILWIRFHQPTVPTNSMFVAEVSHIGGELDFRDSVIFKGDADVIEIAGLILDTLADCMGRRMDCGWSPDTIWEVW